MPTIITFIGNHNSGKTTLATKVVGALKEMGYRVGVIKSSHTKEIPFDTPNTDTDKYRKAEADAVMLVAPDQIVYHSNNKDLSLEALAHRYFQDVDIIIGEGFKQERRVAKIEVMRHKDQALRREVTGVVAVATDLSIDKDNYSLFRLDDYQGLATFIEKRYQEGLATKVDDVSLLVNNKKIPLKSFVRDALSGTVTGFVKQLRYTENAGEIELRIRLDTKK